MHSPVNNTDTTSVILMSMANGVRSPLAVLEYLGGSLRKLTNSETVKNIPCVSDIAGLVNKMSLNPNLSTAFNVTVAAAAINKLNEYPQPVTALVCGTIAAINARTVSNNTTQPNRSGRNSASEIVTTAAALAIGMAGVSFLSSGEYSLENACITLAVGCKRSLQLSQLTAITGALVGTFFSKKQSNTDTPHDKIAPGSFASSELHTQ